MIQPWIYLGKPMREKIQVRKKGIEREWIQSNTTPDLGHHMRKWQKHQKKTSPTREIRGRPNKPREKHMEAHAQIGTTDIAFQKYRDMILPRTWLNGCILLWTDVFTTFISDGRCVWTRWWYTSYTHTNCYLAINTPTCVTWVRSWCKVAVLNVRAIVC